MSIYGKFPTHWRKAVDLGDASGFAARADLVEFFKQTSGDGLAALSDAQRGHVVDLRSAFGAEYDQAHYALLAERDRETDRAAAAIAPAFAPAGSSGLQASPEAARETRAAKVAAGWDAAIAKVNADLMR